MKALVLAGGFPQIALIEELKSRGIYTILADWNEEPVAKKHADKFYQASTLDTDAITEIARKEKVDLLLTACTDQALLTVAYVSEKLGLPCYIDYQTALNVTNKAYMKKVFDENGISTAKHIVLGELDESKLDGWEFPLIVKPVDCNSSKGVKKVTDMDELRVAFADAVRFSRTNTAIIESFIEGPEVSVDIYVEGGKAHVLCISNNDKIADKDKFVIFRGRCPARELDAVRGPVEKTAQQITDAFGLKDTPMLIQLITDGKRVFVLEFSARTGGGTKFLRIKKMTGFDVIKAVVDLTLGLKPHVEHDPACCNYLADEFIYCKPGSFDHLEGFEELKAEGVMDDYYVFKWKGAAFTGVESSGDRAAGFTITADTLEEFRRKHDIVASRIKVIGADGTDIMRHDLLTALT
ncbi:MAG: ATP-grasp domain-containing protein [Oscillospiraceae bacterium]|nr:ATP-grasp domain-containing protein [Oscillospiraceae bacterium]